MATYWITNYALTAGVFKVDAEVSGDYVYYRHPKATGSSANYKTQAKLGTDAHKTRRAAMDRVHEMATRELQAIERKQAKLQRLIIGLEGAVPA